MCVKNPYEVFINFCAQPMWTQLFVYNLTLNKNLIRIFEVNELNDMLNDE